MKKNYHLCNKAISITAEYFPEDSAHWQLFEADGNDTDISISCIISDELPAADGELVLSRDGISVYEKNGILFRYENMGTDSGSVTHIYSEAPLCSKVEIVKRNYNVLMDRRYMWQTVSINRLLLEKKALFFHASYIGLGGDGIIFSAPCGTGKSTQAALWAEYENAQIINGDKAGVSLDDNTAFVHGLPFCGTSGICHNITLPLKAIVLLSQAKENTVTELTGINAVQLLMNNIYLDFIAPDEHQKCVDLLIELIGRVKIYHLACTPDKNAVSALKKALYG